MKCKPIDIKCPDCGELARFEEPFEFLINKNVDADETRPCYQWGGWVVVERFPSQISWQAPSGSSQFLRGGGDDEDGGYPLLTNGLVQCQNCYANSKHTLHWPIDAYWQWEIRGELLWAWDKAHAQMILDHVRKKTRPSRSSNYLRYIPSHFLSSKVRELVVRKLERGVNCL